jgi:hypothetical protein
MSRMVTAWLTEVDDPDRNFREREALKMRDPAASIEFLRSTGIPISIDVNEVLKFNCQYRFVPSGPFGQPVISDDVGTNLILSQVLKSDRRNAFHAQQLCRRHTSMTRDDYIVVVNQHRIGESKFLDAARNLSNLVFGMCPRVVAIRGQILGRKFYDRKLLANFVCFHACLHDNPRAES